MTALWIGGPPGAGKTTVARLLARRHGLLRYSADAHTWEHRDRAIAAGCPAAVRWEALSREDRWAAPADELLAMSLHHERGPMIADDVRALPSRFLAVVEGTPVTPPHADGPALWLLPTPRVQRERLAERDLAPGPLALYRRLVREIGDQVDAHGAALLPVDGARSVQETLTEVERHFADALSTGPRATRPADRSLLLRRSNRADVSQYLAFAARPWAPSRTALETVLPLACECGRTECGEDVAVRVRDFAGMGSVTAAGHG